MRGLAAMADIDLTTLARCLDGEISAGQVLAPGPGHSAADRSLSIKLDDDAPDGFIVHSFAGDDPIGCRDYVREKAGLPPRKPGGGNGKIPAKGKSPIVAQYVYQSADGAPYLRVNRRAVKKDGFFQEHWTGSAWVPGAPRPKIPYRLPELLAASPTTPVYVTEGEKDSDSLAKLGFVATTNSEGADNGKGSKWTPELNGYFKDRHVIILPDNDAPGHQHARHVARNIDGVAASVKIVELPGLDASGDVSDFLEGDPSGARVVKECTQAPLWLGDADDADREEIGKLAALPKLKYAKVRKAKAKALGITAKDLDEAVDEVPQREERGALASQGVGRGGQHCRVARRAARHVQPPRHIARARRGDDGAVGPARLDD
jgi:hypothetical protein